MTLPFAGFPILESDPSRPALTEPSLILRRLDVPEHCVVCFFREVLEEVLAERDCKLIRENRWEDSPHPLYKEPGPGNE